MMGIKLIWERLGKIVIQSKERNGEVKYYIFDKAKGEQIIFWNEDMLAMCQAVINKAKEGESKECVL